MQIYNHLEPGRAIWDLAATVGDDPLYSPRYIIHVEPS